MENVSVTAPGVDPEEEPSENQFPPDGVMIEGVALKRRLPPPIVFTLKLCWGGAGPFIGDETEMTSFVDCKKGGGTTSVTGTVTEPFTA